MANKKIVVSKNTRRLVMQENVAAYAFMLPFLLFFVGFVLYPMFMCVYTSFFDATMGREDIFIGLQNYKDLFQDEVFWVALRNTMVIVLVSVPVTCAFSLWVASIISKMPVAATSAFRCIFYLPVVTGSVAVTMVWKWMYNNYYGIFNYIGTSTGLIDKNIPFLTDGPTWQMTYTLVGVWQNMGWGTILYLSAITGINMELFEAAKIDGANKLQQIWHVTLPGIRSTIVVLLILNIGQMMNISFDRPYILGNTLVQDYCDVLSTFVYRTGITNAKFDRATAIGLFQSVVGFIMITAANFVTKQLGEDGIW